MIDATALLRLYARRRHAVLAREDPAKAQRRQLLELVGKAKNTRFGRDHDFAKINSISDFQARVRLRSYEALWDQYWREPFPVLEDVTWPGRIPYLALSSGTTSGRTKYIPVSKEMTAANRRAALDILVHHLTARPESRILGGRSFILGGSTDLERLAPGVLAGDLSGIAAREVPFWARSRTFPPPDLAFEAAWEKKIRALAPASLNADVRAFTGTPSWMLFFLDTLMDAHPERPRRIEAFYPNLELVVHGGIGFGPYRHRFEELLEGSRAELREVYPASEGFVAIADRGSGEGLRMLLGNGLFFEFVPRDELEAQNPTRHWIGTVETGIDYALIVSSHAGLWAYVLGDTVRLIERSPPRLLVTGRTSYFLSDFGEHLEGEEVESAVSEAASSIRADIVDYSVGSLFKARGDPFDAHLYLLEFVEPPSPERTRVFIRTVDALLEKANADYAAHRQSGQLAAPQIALLPPGGFAAWMKRRGKLGGQNKVPRIVTDLDLFDDLRRFAGTGT